MPGLRLSAAAHFPATSFVAVLGVISASVFMDMTGGGLKPYEMQTAQAAFAYVVGDASAAEVLDGPAPRYPSWREQAAAPPGPMVYTTQGALGAGLMGGLAVEVSSRFEPAPVEAAQPESPTCPSGVQWVSTASAEAST
jgi:hypothetical protein